MQELPGRKPDWLNDNKLFSLKTLYSLLNKKFHLTSHDLKRMKRGLHKEGPRGFNIRTLIIS